ncbi:MAG TPA: type VI secretion system baseplate subunit TssF [Thermoanaerobaculia bacterium]
MAIDGREELLRSYWRELAYLRRMGAAFAETYPKVAGRLELGDDVSPDPHVERLIESFAFLTARIQQNLDSEFPEIAVELLNILHPHYLNPVPSMAVASFEVDPDRGKLTSGHTIPKHTPLFTRAATTISETEAVCRFRTCYPVTLWPVAVAQAGFESPAGFAFLDNAPDVASVLRLRIESRAGSLAELGLDRLRFYLDGDRLLVDALYEALFCQCAGVALLPEGDPARRPVRLPADVVQPVGFGRDEEVLPYPPFSQPAYRLVQEYFTFPEKYLFLDVAGLERHGSEKAFDILILLRRAPGSWLSQVDRETFVLGATPVINLFSRTTEPIRLDHRRSEYPLVPDARRERFTEIHSISSVSGSSDPRMRGRVYEPFYSFNHHMAARGQKAFWHARRIPSLRKDVPGSEMLLTLVDLDFQPFHPASETIYAHTLCTNRALAEQLMTGALLQTDVAAPVSRIVCRTKPTPQISPPTDGSTLWRLISHLSLNYLSFTSGEEGLTALREILKLYCPSEHSAAHQQIQGIRGMSLRQTTQRVGGHSWRGFCRGTEVTLAFDENAYVGGGAFLLASVLNRFFALYTSLNSFTQLVIKSQQREGVWKRWQPMAGEQTVL